jgi:hypothetical protein
MRTLAAGIVVLGLALYAVLPPAAQSLAADPAQRDVRGVVHVHTSRSDGTGSVEDVARAAARAGLQFVVITDHGDATREPDRPAYRSGVLCIDAVEISTTGGHVVALGLPEAPYPLGGEPADVVDDIHRLGGMAIAAHPGSPKKELAWRDWDAPVDGLEWINSDSEWRDERAPALLRALISYPLRPREALASLLDRPVPVMEQWDRLLATRRTVALAAPDAHARMGLTSPGEPYDTSASVRLPSYRALFGALSVSAHDVMLSGDAPRDAEAILSAIRTGRFHSTIDGVASVGTLRLTASNALGRAEDGQALPAGMPALVAVHTNAPAGARIEIFRNGQVWQTVDGNSVELTVSGEPAVYRAEVTLPRAPGVPPVPWMVSNPVYIGARAETVKAAAPVRTQEAFWKGDFRDAKIEKNTASEGALSTATPPGSDVELQFRYALGGRVSDHPYAAVSLPVSIAPDANAVVELSAHADRPMRVSVQLRSPGSGDGHRWRTSIYLDDTSRTFSIPVDRMRPVDDTSASGDLGSVNSLLVVVDSVNTSLGNGGRVWLTNARLARRR